MIDICYLQLVDNVYSYINVALTIINEGIKDSCKIKKRLNHSDARIFTRTLVALPVVQKIRIRRYNAVNPKHPNADYMDIYCGGTP